MVVGHQDGVLAAPGVVRSNRWLMGRDHAANRVWERYGMNRLLARASVPAPSGLLDVGANMGEFAIAFGSRFSGHVRAYEPDPIARVCLSWNTSDYDISIVDKALSNVSGTVPLYLATANADSSLEKPQRSPHITTASPSTIPAVAQRLDQIDLNQLGEYPLLKVDAEGHEPEVLLGAGESIRRFVFVAVDAGPERQGRTTNAVVRSILEKQGFDTSMWRSHIVHAWRRSL